MIEDQQLDFGESVLQVAWLQCTFERALGTVLGAEWTADDDDGEAFVKGIGNEIRVVLFLALCECVKNS